MQDLQDAINDVLDWVPWGLGWLAVKIRDPWNGLMDKIKEFFDPLVQIQFTGGISSALKDVSSALPVFFGLMIAAIGAWIAAIITALGATATIFGIPAGIAIAIAAAAGFGAAFWGAGGNLESQCRSAKTLLEQKMSENTAYPNGAWPVATL